MLSTNWNIYHVAQTSPNGGWGDWLKPGGDVSHAAVAINRDGRLELFGRRRSGSQLIHTRQTNPGGVWGGWEIELAKEIPGRAGKNPTLDFSPKPKDPGKSDQDNHNGGDND